MEFTMLLLLHEALKQHTLISAETLFHELALK